MLMFSIDEEKSCSKQSPDNSYDLNKPHTRGVLGVLRYITCYYYIQRFKN